MLFAVVLLAVSMRNLASVAVPLTFVLTTQLLTLGPMGYLGVKLNLVLAILPPLTFVIVLATAVHLLVRYRELLSLGRDAIAAAAETYRDKGWAVLWTGVTTLVGFGSLGSSPVGPVRSLGLWSSIALTVMLAAAFSLYPALLVSWVGSGRSDRRALEGLLRRHGRAWAEGAARRRRVWMTAAALVLGLSAVGTGRLRVESNALTYLAAEHPARRAVEALEASGIGSAAVELVLSLPPSAAGDGGFRQRQRLQALAALAAELRRGELVTGVVSAGDVAAAGSGVANELGGFGALAAQGALEQALRPFLAADGGTTRLTLFTHIVGFDRLDRLREVAAAAARRAFPAAAVTVTGQYPLLLETQRRLISTLSTSFSVTLLCVAVILAFLVGHWRYMLLSLVPSAGPVLCVLGLMGWAGVPLDVATVMVAAVILGLAVDDTIHTLNHFRELAPKVGRLEAVASTLEHTAGAYVLSGLILVAGFGVCALSSFAPTARFGGLSAVGIALSVVGAIFVVPALLGKAER